ncbi:MAG: hypothetical protein IT425_05350 [Pirellulales bacterium]|nr:hypothetical protein [Pirellulales bacterium]
MAIPLRILLFLACSLVTAAPVVSANLDAILYPLSGEVHLRNTSASPVGFVLYSITSSSMSLDPSPLAWRSISDEYDASGNGFIDPTYQWTKLGTTTSNLAEAVFSGPGGSLAPYRTLNLGAIWNASNYPMHGLVFDIRELDTTPIAVSVSGDSLPFGLVGDYDFSGEVDSEDYSLWRFSYGSTTNLAADGNLDGNVDTADYVVWRSHFGETLFGAGSNVGGGTLVLGGSPVPEPHAIGACLAGLLFLAMSRLATFRATRRK